MALRSFARVLVFSSVAVLAVFAGLHAEADDRTNIPLKNWGGFSLYRDAVYDDLERLVSAGLADRAILNTKPINRTEAARIVARAIEKIRRDEGGYNNRRDLEPLIDRLIEEFRSELAALRVTLPSTPHVAPPFVSFTPVDRAQMRLAYTNRDIRPENHQGLSLKAGINGGTTFESRMQIGDVVTFYLQPEFHGNEFFAVASLATGYVKFSLFNFELLAGRDSLWWGPGYHGSLIMSNNGPPLDQVRIGPSEAFRLPLVGDWIGPTKILAFIARLEDDPGHRHPELFGMRGTVSPFSFLELGASYVQMFGGDDPPRLRSGDFLKVLFNPNASDQASAANDRFRNNVLFALDAELRFHDVHRYFLPAQDLRIYGEFGWDDTCCGTAFVPLRAGTSYLGGLHLLGLFGQEGLDARMEIASTSGFSFTHNQFYRGYWTQGQVISHFIGTSGFDLFTRVTKRISTNFQLGTGFRRSEIGNTANGSAGAPKETRIGGSLDVTYRFMDVWSLFGQFDLLRTTNRNFVPNDNGIDAVVLLELTRSFR